MHVLGTPPAFVLSQDQTLKKLYLKRFHASNHFLNNRFWQLTQEFSLAVFRLRFKQIHKFVKGVLFVFALFNLQGTAAFRSRSKLAYLSTASSICQELFSSFFKFQPVPCCFLLPCRELPNIITTIFVCQVLFPSFVEFLFATVFGDVTFTFRSIASFP